MPFMNPYPPNPGPSTLEKIIKVASIAFLQAGLLALATVYVLIPCHENCSGERALDSVAYVPGIAFVAFAALLFVVRILISAVK